MSYEPDMTRLAHLKLERFGFGALVYFCSHCDFDTLFTDIISRCPRCEKPVVLATVTPELVRTARAA